MSASAMSAGPSGENLATHLRQWDDGRLTRLLRLRPDLATPAPSSLTSLAARTSSRASVTRTLGEVDRPTLTVAEALAVLGTSQMPVSLDRLSAAVGFMADDVTRHLQDLGLVFGEPEALWLVDAAREVLSAQPLGLGPSLQALRLDAADGWPTTASAVQHVLAEAPDGARRVLDVLAWGPPVGRFEQMPPAGQWLLDARVVHRRSATEVVLPREVALALRGERLVREVPLQPPVPEAPVRDGSMIAAESAQAGEQILREIDLVVRAWAQDPAPVLRTGGLGVREVKRIADLVEADPARAALVVELAGMLGLIGQHVNAAGSVWAPTPVALDEAPLPVAERWAGLVAAWLDSARTPWLVGTRDAKDALRSALAPDLQRGWAPRLRRRVLTALATWPAGSAPSVEAVHDHVAWHTPRSAPPVETVAAVLGEAAALGLTSAGALSRAARVLIGADGSGDPGRSGDNGRDEEARRPQDDVRTEAVSEAFAADLPPAVSELFIQGDLTGVVPGRPSPDLAALLERTAVIESRGSAMTVRFTAESIRRALDHGWSGEQILARLEEHSRTGVPQPLEYLVTDTARSHGHLRVGRARSFLRSEQEGALSALLGDPQLDGLGLQLLAPTVAIAQVGPQELLDVLREAGHSALAETLDGQVVAVQPRQVRANRDMPAPPVSATVAEDPQTLDRAVAQMRTGEDQVVAGNGHSEDPVYALELLRQAAQRGNDVELVIAGSAGASQKHRVRPLSVAGGRVRVLDVRRQTELTVAAHRIVSVGT